MSAKEIRIARYGANRQSSKSGRKCAPEQNLSEEFTDPRHGIDGAGVLCGLPLDHMSVGPGDIPSFSIVFDFLVRLIDLIYRYHDASLTEEEKW